MWNKQSYLQINKYLIKILKKKVNAVTNRAFWEVCVHWESYIFFFNKAKVSVILYTAHSENDMNKAVGKCIKRSIIWNHEFKVCRSHVSSEAELSSCLHSIRTTRPSRREHAIVQDTNTHFTTSHNWIRLSLQGLWNQVFIRHSKIGLNYINVYLLNADGKRESIIMFAFLLLII